MESSLTPDQLTKTLQTHVQKNIFLSIMLWGAPGIGKSSIVSQVTERNNIELIDLRLSQLAPTDIRGLPVADHDTKVSRWYPPEFLPREGRGVLFLDEINMAPPSLQGIAQQLILDRRVGSYVVPDGWYIWAAGNRKEDHAAVFDMPAPLGNRFLHYQISPDLESFRLYGLEQGLNEQILAFIAYRPELLHKATDQQMAWPSPRSWVMASELHSAGLKIDAAVGVAAEAEFEAFVALIKQMPDLRGILRGKGTSKFPDNPSVRYAVTIGLVARAKKSEQALNALTWMMKTAPPEWVQLLAVDLLRLARRRGYIAEISRALLAKPEAKTFLKDFRELIGLA